MSLFERACVNKRLFLFLLLVCILVNIAVLSYASSLGLLHINELPVPFAVAILILIAQAAINSAIAIFVGLFLGKKVGLGAPILEAWINSEPLEKRPRPILIISVVSGIFVGVALFILDRFAFAFFAEPVTAFSGKDTHVAEISYLFLRWNRGRGLYETFFDDTGCLDSPQIGKEKRHNTFR